MSKAISTVLFPYNRLVNKGFGSDCEKYSWVQTLKDVTITIPVASGVKSRQIKCSIEPKHVYMGVVGEEGYRINGELFQRIKVDNSLWTIETDHDQRIVRIELDKNEGESWWPYVVEGDIPIDTTKIEPPPSGLNDLDGELRSQVEKMMYDQRQKENGQPTSEEQKKIAALNEFKKQHPEMDFSNAVME